MALGVVALLGAGVAETPPEWPPGLGDVAFGVVVDGDRAFVVVHRIPCCWPARCRALSIVRAPSGPSFRVGDDTTAVRVAGPDENDTEGNIAEPGRPRIRLLTDADPDENDTEGNAAKAGRPVKRG